MKKALIGYGLLYALLMALLLWAAPADANEPLVIPESTCQGWYVSWQADKTELRTAMRQSIKNSLDKTNDPALESWGLCLLMNVDYIINTILGGCDAGFPLDTSFVATLQATGNRCS